MFTCIGATSTALTTNYFRLLAHMYTAECLVLLDKISEAIDHLNPDNIKDISFDFPDSEKTEENQIKTNPPPSKYSISGIQCVSKVRIL